MRLQASIVADAQRLASAGAEQHLPRPDAEGTIRVRRPRRASGAPSGRASICCGQMASWLPCLPCCAGRSPPTCPAEVSGCGSPGPCPKHDRPPSPTNTCLQLGVATLPEVAWRMASKGRRRAPSCPTGSKGFRPSRVHKMCIAADSASADLTTLVTPARATGLFQLRNVRCPGHIPAAPQRVITRNAGRMMLDPRLERGGPSRSRPSRPHRPANGAGSFREIVSRGSLREALGQTRPCGWGESSHDPRKYAGGLIAIFAISFAVARLGLGTEARSVDRAVTLARIQDGGPQWAAAEAQYPELERGAIPGIWRRSRSRSDAAAVGT